MEVGGSNPSEGTFAGVTQLVEYLPSKQNAESSRLFSCTDCRLIYQTDLSLVMNELWNVVVKRFEDCVKTTVGRVHLIG